MHVFGEGSGQHLAHFHARCELGSVQLEWEVRNAPALRWRVSRSQHDLASLADALPGSGQTRVMEGYELQRLLELRA
jgi:alpha-D-ribose 1-methylphosphonate 5-triphosphate diphosphatase PhnM